MSETRIEEDLLEGISERGNSLFVNAEDNMMLFLAECGKDKWLQVDYCLSNYPSTHISIIHMTKEVLAAKLQKNVMGWDCTRCSIPGVVLDAASCVKDMDE